MAERFPTVSGEAAQARAAFSARLWYEAGLLAGRLADVLARMEGGRAPEAPLAALSQLRAPAEPPPQVNVGVHPLDRLASALALAPVERDLLLLTGLPEEHETFSTVLRALHPRGEPRPTVALAAQLFCRSQQERQLLRDVLELGEATRSGAVRVVGDVPFFERTLEPADALWPALHGLDVWPAVLHPVREPAALAGLEEWFEGQTVRPVARALTRRDAVTIALFAESEEVAARRAAALVQHLGLGFARVRPAGAPGTDTERALSLHALVRGAVPILEIPPTEGPQSGSAPVFHQHPGPVVVCQREGSATVRGARPVVVLRVDRPAISARTAMWRELLPELASDAPLLATRFSLEPGTAQEVANDVRGAQRLDGGPATAEEVARCVRTRSNLAVSQGVRLVRPTASWKDLVLPPDTLAQLREAVGRLSHKYQVLERWGFLEGRPGARGVRLLFSGPPGTGKSLSAEVLASAVGVDLLAVDISRVVSKWVGETEKNLSALFEAAERAHAILFFDEADALFGVRTEVSDAHDRYANLETAYLLARLERFEGLIVLATNLRDNIDPAFTRRLEFIIDFDEPDAAQRKAIWKAHLPQRAPLAPDVDLEELSTLYAVVGGFIRNAATAAAFLAAAEGVSIQRRHLVRAIRREYEKSGRAFPGLPPGMASLPR